MIDTNKALQQKEKILSILRLKGPSLPVQIARTIETQPLFASAFLSELKAERRIKISSMRVGNSPIYFIPGHEQQLEKFVEYLNEREKEAFFLLKKEKILEDNSQTPVIRVALRAIKDFAVPLNINLGSESKIFWKYFTLENKHAIELIDESVKGAEIPEKTIPAVEQPAAPKSGEKIPQIKEQEINFSEKIKNYLAEKNIEVMDIIAEKKKEFVAKVRIDSLFGKQFYYLVAKDKKSITEKDLIAVFEKAHKEKMPAAFFSQGELNKKAKEHAKQWSNLIKFEKLKF